MIKDDVELLDLCIFAYQLHSQTLLCAPDTYGEQMQQETAGGARRYRFLYALERLLYGQPPVNANRQAEVSNIKGYSNILNSGPHVTVAPIPSKYDRISPYFPGFVRPNRDTGDERWIKYSVDGSITSTIGHWATFAYPNNAWPQPPGAIVNSARRRRSAIRMARGPSPDHVGTIRLRRLQSFPPR